MMSKRIIFILYILLTISFKSQPSKAQPWVRVGYFFYEEDEYFPISNIDSSLFTHLICGFADLNPISYELSLSDSANLDCSIFTTTVKKKNPSVTALLSIGGRTDTLVLSSMARDSFHRKSFIDSSIKMARLFGFEGLDLWWVNDMSNLDILFEEWQDAITLEARNSTGSKLILTAAVNYAPRIRSYNYPIESIQQHLDWVHVTQCNDFLPQLWENFTAAPYALYNPSSTVCSTDLGITDWINVGLSAKKIVLLLPYFGYPWTLVNPKENGIGAPARGEAEGIPIRYMEIKNIINLYRAKVTFDKNYVVNYFTMGTSWISFDDVESIQYKVSYAKEKGLLGYFVWQVAYDDNWVLSQAAAHELEGNKGGQNNSAAPEVNKVGQNKQSYSLVFIILPIIIAAVIILLLGLVIYFRWVRKLKLKVQESRRQVNNIASAAGDFNANAPNLASYSFAYIEAAANRFSIENKLGEGGYGPVYKAVFPDGQEVAVKKLSKTSTQGYEEFKNEVMLTAMLQHVNLVRLLGFCIEREEHMLIYEYMTNRSLDYYLFDPIRKYTLDWKKRIDIIEGVCQGLLYLQEYSRIFRNDGLEANTERIVGTCGYAPPEYLRKGIYSTKSDVYSFGVLLLQIISGKRVSILYGENDNLSLLAYAYELWKDGKGHKAAFPMESATLTSVIALKRLPPPLISEEEAFTKDQQRRLNLFHHKIQIRDSLLVLII
ncbi:hypothetical protein LWI28_005700 [Acer negundo]|uniref:Uncharacterized protein n=1 Tax=Acer negundo TaxID=4023 RepID=A0AAD5J3Y5_ACENE|nr:hypothetical protein LWI28_005700 [Acer negundo]